MKPPAVDRLPLTLGRRDPTIESYLVRPLDRLGLTRILPVDLEGLMYSRCPSQPKRISRAVPNSNRLS